MLVLWGRKKLPLEENRSPIFRFLGAFAKQRKAAMSFVMSVRPSVRMEQLGSNCTDFHDN
jgi:hypothetical protein